MTAIFKRQAEINSAVRSERNSRTSPAFSVSRVIGAMAGENRALDGYEREVIDEIVRAKSGYYDPSRIPLPLELLSDPTIKPDVLARDLTMGSNSAGGYLTQTATAPVQSLLRPWSIAAQAGVTVIPGALDRGGSHSLVIPKIASDMTAGWLANEGSSLTPSDLDLGKLTLSPKSGGVFTNFSRLLARQGKVADGLLQLQMLKAIGSLVDQAIVSGTGSDGQPLGILNTPGLAHMTGCSYPGLLTAEYNSEMGGSVNAFALVTHPLVRSHIKREDYLHRWVHDGTGQRLGGWPAYVCKDVPNDSAIAGPWEDCIFALWGTPVLEINPNDPAGFKANIIQARIVIDCDLGLLNPGLWMKFTNITNLPEIEII